MTQKTKDMRPSHSSRPARKPRLQKNARTSLVSAQKKPDINRRSHERVHLRIPVHLRILGKEVQGFTHDLSPTGLRIISHTELPVATPMAMQFCFGGETCYAQIVGQVVFCRKHRPDSSANHEIGIKFAA